MAAHGQLLDIDHPAATRLRAVTPVGRTPVDTAVALSPELTR